MTTFKPLFFSKPLSEDHKLYTIEQFPKNKDIIDLSEEQKFIRLNQKKVDHKETKVCKKCTKELPIEEFYKTKKNSDKRRSSCKDCNLKQAGVIEIGKIRFSKKILQKGFRICTCCKNIKPILDFTKNKNRIICKDCRNTSFKNYIKKQSDEIAIHYIKQYGKRKYNLKNFNLKTINKLKLEILKKRKPKYFIDNKEFIILQDFLNYVKSVYGIPTATTKLRIKNGKTEEECKLSQIETRSKAIIKGKIKVIDTITSEIFIFESTQDKNLKKMFSNNTITKYLKTGEKTNVTSSSKYKNPCIITRI